MDYLDTLHAEHRQTMHRCLMEQVRMGREMLAQAVVMSLPTNELANQIAAIAQLEQEACQYAD